MKVIAPAAIPAIVLIDIAGLIPTPSVGGPLALLLIVLVAMVAVGIHEAWTNGRGILGWIVNIAAALVGGIAGALAAGMTMDVLLSHLQLDGPLATSRHPLRYLSSAGLMTLTLAGSWLALTIVNRFR